MIVEGLQNHDTARAVDDSNGAIGAANRHPEWAVLCIALSVCLSSCQSEPITDERVSQTLARCCVEVRTRVEAVDDRQSAKFRDHCDACRMGSGKKQCE